MRILQINIVFPYGSTGNIVKNLDRELKLYGYESFVIYGRGWSIGANQIRLCSLIYYHFQKIISRITGFMYGGCYLSTHHLKKRIKKIKPDIVHLHCLNGNFVNVYTLIEWLKRNNIKTVLTLHAEFIHTANCSHALDCDKWLNGCGSCPRLKQETHSFLFDKTAKSWKKMKKAFDGFNENLIIASVSPWLMERAKRSPILLDKKHCVVMNGLDEGIFHYYGENDFRKKMGLINKKIIFHATPSFSDNENNIKGGLQLIKLAKKFENNSDIVFVIAGPNNCKCSLPNNIILLGKIENQIELAKYYSTANLTLLTSAKETFSMVTIESLCCGTPVVGFKAGGPESIGISNYSCFVDYGNIDDLYEIVKIFLKMSINKIDLSKLACKVYSNSEMCNNYYTLYNELYYGGKL